MGVYGSYSRQSCLLFFIKEGTNILSGTAHLPLKLGFFIKDALKWHLSGTIIDYVI